MKFLIQHNFLKALAQEEELKMKNSIKKISTLATVLFGSFLTKSLAFAQITNPVIGDLGDDAAAAQDGDTFAVLAGKLLEAVVIVGALAMILYLIWGGISWITAGGDKSKVETARNKITQAIIGIIVLASAIAIFTLIQSFFGFEVLTFTS